MTSSLKVNSTVYSRRLKCSLPANTMLSLFLHSLHPVLSAKLFTFLKRCFPQLTVCILYSLLSKAIHTGSAPGTITFICQFATPILGATILLYAAFIDLNRFAVLSVCFYSFLIVTQYFRVYVLLFILLLYDCFSHCFYLCCMYVCYVLFLFLLNTQILK